MYLSILASLSKDRCEHMVELTKRQKQFVLALTHLDAGKCRELLESLSSGDDGPLHPEKVVVPALEEIGRAWEIGHMSLSQVYMAGRICEQVMDEILPKRFPSQQNGLRLAIGVIEDFHALGKRMVTSSLRAAGYNPIDLGHGLNAEQMVTMALENQVDILLISCLMLASAVHVKDVVSALEKADSRIAVVVGGAPFRLDPLLWRETGACAMGRNSADAVKIVQELIGE